MLCNTQSCGFETPTLAWPDLIPTACYPATLQQRYYRQAQGGRLGSCNQVAEVHRIRNELQAQPTSDGQEGAVGENATQRKKGSTAIKAGQEEQNEKYKG